jgi:Tfp pilus assembly protein PilO
MGRFGIPDLLVLIIVIVILITPFLFLRTLQNTIKATNPKNRTIEPGEVWLALIPFFGMILHISHIYKISNTLQKDFDYKKMYQYKPSIFGKGNGLTYSYFSLIQFIVSFTLVYFYLTNNYESNDDFSNWLEFNNSIFRGLSFGSIVALIHVIIYWNKMLKCKAMLLAYKVENSNLHSDYKSDYQNSVSYSIKNNKIDELIKIKKLLDEKLISQIEFESLKSDIIGEKALSTNDIKGENISSINPILDLHSNKKTCPNCKISLPIYTKKCGSCGYEFISNKIVEQNISSEISKTNDKIEESKNEVLNELEHYNVEKQNSKRIYYMFFGIILILLFAIWFYNDSKNKINLSQNMKDKMLQDSILSAKSKDSISEELNAYKTKAYQDSISLANQQIDTLSDENSESSEVNNKISLGGYYHGGIIFHLDYDKKHGLIRTNTIENEDGFTWDMAKQASEEYINDGFDNWYLPESEELEMIFANKNDNLLKDGKYWCLLDGSKNGNFLGYTSSDNSFWTTSRDYRVPMAIFISKF